MPEAARFGGQQRFTRKLMYVPVLSGETIKVSKANSCKLDRSLSEQTLMECISVRSHMVEQSVL